MKKLICGALLLVCAVAQAADLYGSLKFTASIASSGSLSASIALQTRRPLALQMPSAFTGTSLTYQCSYDNETFADLYDDAGTEVTTTVAASRYIALEPATFAGCEFLKVRSGTAASPTAEGAARSIQVLAGRILQ
jgi:hypothetical protein